MTPYDPDPQIKLLFERFSEPSMTALDRLLTAAGIHEYLDQVMPVLAKVARDEEGHTWADVGEVLQVTRQAAYQRLGKQPFRYPDGKGGMQIVDPESRAYLDSLQQARTALVDEGGRDADVAVIDHYLRAVASGEPAEGLNFVPVEIEVEVEVPVSPAKAAKAKSATAARRKPPTSAKKKR